MTQKRSKPAPLATGTGSGNCKAVAACIPEFSARTHSDQSAFALDMIARRFRVSPSTALAHVEAFGFGGGR